MDRSTAMTIAVEFEIRQESTSTSEWMDAWGIRARDAFEHEPETTAYEAAIAGSDPSRVLVFERYEGGEETLREHMGRPAHKALTDKMQSGRMTRRRPWIAMGYEVDGFGWQFSQEAESGIEGDGIVLAVIALSSSHTMALVDSCREHADACFSNDLGTLLYGLSTVSVEDDKDVHLREGDLIVSLAFKDLAAYESHMKSDPWDRLRAETERLDGRILLSRSYVTTGRGFLWKGHG